MNLVVLAKQRGGGAESYYRTDGRGNNALVGGCVTMASKVGNGDDAKLYDYSSGGCD